MEDACLMVCVRDSRTHERRQLATRPQSIYQPVELDSRQEQPCTLQGMSGTLKFVNRNL